MLCGSAGKLKKFDGLRQAVNVSGNAMRRSLINLSLLLIGLGHTSCGTNDSHKENKLDEAMNDDPSTILRLISSNPSYVPNQEQEQQAKDFLAKIYPRHKIESISTDTIEFVDQGQNFDSIICPFCEKDIETEYWQYAMEKADQTHFTDLTMITPCCKKSTSLNDLRYVTPAGFAKYVLSVNDPETEMKHSDLSILQKMLETTLRTVYAHY